MDKYLDAERGGIYIFNNGKDDRECLVVSSGRRHRDNLISVLFLTTDRGNISDDVVRFEEAGQNMSVRTDLVTYTRRLYLKRKVAQVSDDVMYRIDKGIARSLGLWEV